MKSGVSYFEAAQSAALRKAGAFFAFGQNQFNEKAKPGVNYVSMGGGLICPKENAQQLADDFEKAYQDGVKADLAENGKEAIIIRELYNHECYYTWDYSVVVEKLEGYGITEEEVRAGFEKEKANAVQYL